MKKLKHGAVWMYLLTKRLLKKPIFLITLALIPLMAFAIGVFSKEESSVVRVALYSRTEDAMAEQVIERLMERDGIVDFQYHETEESAIDAVRNGKADSAWGFSENFSDRLRRYARKELNPKREPLLYITEQEENLTLRLAQENLYGGIIPTLSREIYVAYLADEYGYDIEAHREELEATYERHLGTEDLIKFKFFGSDAELSEINYLATPIRGIVAVMMVVCGMAAAMVFLREKERGVYSYMGGRRQLPVLLGTCVSALTVCGIVALAAMWLSGNFTTWYNELGMMALYILSCVPFCVFFGQVCRKSSVLAVLTPLIVVLMLVFNPVFINHNIGRFIQVMLPPYYYLNAVLAPRYISSMLWYIVQFLIVCFAIEEFSNRSTHFRARRLHRNTQKRNTSSDGEK